MRSKLLRSVMLQAREHVLERRTERLAHDLRALEVIERVDPGGRQRRRLDRLGVALDRRSGIDLVGDAVAHAGKDRGDHEIGIGVGAGNAMLDARRGTVAAGNAQGDRAIVEAPMRGHGDIGLRHVAPVGVGGLGPDGHEIGHGLAHAAERVTEQRRDGIAGEEVLSRSCRAGSCGCACPSPPSRGAAWP